MKRGSNVRRVVAHILKHDGVEGSANDFQDLCGALARAARVRYCARIMLLTGYVSGMSKKWHDDKRWHREKHEACVRRLRPHQRARMFPPGRSQSLSSSTTVSRLEGTTQIPFKSRLGGNETADFPTRRDIC